MSRRTYAGDYVKSAPAILAGAISSVMASGESKSDIASMLDSHARRLRKDSEEEFEMLTVMPADSTFDHINYVVVDAEGEEYLLESVDQIDEFIEENLEDD